MGSHQPQVASFATFNSLHLLLVDISAAKTSSSENENERIQDDDEASIKEKIEELRAKAVREMQKLENNDDSDCIPGPESVTLRSIKSSNIKAGRYLTRL